MAPDINRSLARHSSRGFTLVELLTVLAIIGLFAALLLPAIQTARESARRVQCLNQVRQLGMAVVHFEMANSRLPPGGYISPVLPGANPNCERSFDANVSDCFDAFGEHGGPTYSWMVLVLPFLDKQTLFDEFDLETRIYEAPGDPHARTVDSFMCPSDVAGESAFDGSGTLADGQGLQFAKGNYAAYVSPVHVNMQRILPAALGGFIPGLSVGQRLARIKDGLSNTLAITEVRTLDREWDSRGAWSLPFPGASLLALDWHPTANLIESPFQPETNYQARLTQTPNGRFLPDQIVACEDRDYAQLRGMKCQEASYFSSAPRSLHVGGVMSVALDTHAGFISDQIDSYVFAYLISVNDEQISEVTKYLR